MKSSSGLRAVWPAAIVLGLSAGTAAAESRVGGHVGAVVPLLTRVGGVTTSIGDDSKLGVPMGITVKKGEKWAFDLELVPVIDPDREGGTSTPLLVHPGVIRSVSPSTAVGLRMGFEVNGNAWGFTPLVNRSLHAGDVTPFVEAVLPIRFQRPSPGDRETSVGFGLHFGLGF